MPETLQPENSTESNFEAYIQAQCDIYNARVGSLTGYDCKACLNKGYVKLVKGGYEIMRECECKPIRDTMRRIERSGLKRQLELCRFDNFKTPNDWQEKIKEKAVRYVTEHDGWFYAGGQVGCGKTHLCTAIVGELIKQGKSARYMLWRDEIVAIKANVNNHSEYVGAMDGLKKAEVLYIDDFFKTEHGTKPTAADVNVAFEIINFRYNDPELITVISSEKTLNDLLDIDEAVGSRIFQKSQKYCAIVNKSNDKNYRMKGIL